MVGKIELERDGLLVTKEIVPAADMGVRAIHIDDGVDQYSDIRAAIRCVMGCRGAREVSAGAKPEDSDFP